MAYISAEIMEGARDGRRVAELMDYGRTLLSRDDVMDGIAEMIDEVQLEATFPDGTKLITIHNPMTLGSLYWGQTLLIHLFDAGHTLK